MLDWLFLIFLLCTFFLYYSLSLSLSLPIYTWNVFRKKRRKTEEEEEQGEESAEVDVEVSWRIADLKTDQLNVFRVNSKRDTLE